MKRIPLLSLFAAALAFSFPASGQTPAAPAPGAPLAAGTKPKPFSASDTRVYITEAESMQFQLKLTEKLRGKFRETNPEMLAFAGKIGKETTDLYTPGVTMAQEHGVPGSVDKKTKTGTIPTDISPADKAAFAKVDALNKDEKKWLLALFELATKESKKGAAEAEKGAKTAQDPDLKAFTEKVAAMLKSQSESIEAKFKELKAAKK